MSFAAVAIMGGVGLLSTAITVSAINDAAKTGATAAKEAADAAGIAATEAAKIAADAATEAARLQTEGAQESARIAADAAQEAARIYAEASEKASAAQMEYGNLAIDEQQRQFTEMQNIMKPWVDQGTQALGELGQYEKAGTDSLARQRALMGLDGADAQRSAIEGISNSPEMLAMIGQGENAMLQQGAATGGLRGGNTQAALAQFRPSILSALIEQQYSKLGGLIDMGSGITMNRATLGQASAAGVGAAGMQSGANIANLLMGQGSASAQGILGSGEASAQGTLGVGNANSAGTMTAAQAAAAGLLGAGNANAQGVLGAGNAYAQGIYNAGNINANAGMAAGNAWAQLPNYFMQGGMLGYGLQNPSLPIDPNSGAGAYSQVPGVF